MFTKIDSSKFYMNKLLYHEDLDPLSHVLNSNSVRLQLINQAFFFLLLFFILLSKWLFLLRRFA